MQCAWGFKRYLNADTEEVLEFPPVGFGWVLDTSLPFEIPEQRIEWCRPGDSLADNLLIAEQLKRITSKFPDLMVGSFEYAFSQNGRFLGVLRPISETKTA